MTTNKPTHELPKEDSPEFIGPKQPKTPPPVEPPKQPPSPKDKPEEPEQDSHPEEV
jgi:hypothetical protein